jgi:hypothetical protein
MDDWHRTNIPPRATIAQVANHIDHVKKVAGIDHIGLGGDFDGITSVPQGLEDVSKYPALTAELLRRGYKEDDVKKILGQNILRVMRQAEETSRRLQAGKWSHPTVAGKPVIVSAIRPRQARRCSSRQSRRHPRRRRRAE